MRYLRWLLVIILVGLAIWRLYPYFKNFEKLLELKQNINFVWLTLSALLIVGQYFGDGWLSQILLQIAGYKINLKNTIKIASIDVFAAHILPIGEAGVIATVSYFYKKIGVKGRDIIFLALAWGAVTNFVLVVFLLTSAVFLPKLPNIPIHLSSLSKILIVLILVISPLVVLKKNFIWIKAKEKFSKYKLFQEIVTFTSNLNVHKEAILDNKSLVLKAFLAGFIYYAANIASLYLAFLTFGKPPQLSLIAFTYLLSLIAAFITLAPAGVGATEATMILVFLQFNIDPALTFAAVLVFRLFSFWLPIPAGLLSYLSLKKYKNDQAHPKSPSL